MAAQPASSLDAFLWAIGQQESGGNYKSVNSSSGALGKYQVMPDNIPSWTKKALGHSISASEYLNSPADQEAVARTILGGYYAKYGAAGAAAAWYSGQPDPNKTYGNPPVYKYVNSVLALMARAPGNAGATAVPPATPDGGTSSGGTTADPAVSISGKKPANTLFGFGIPGGYVSLLTYGQARALEGGLLLVAGGIVAMGGVIVLTTFGVKASGIAAPLQQAAGSIPGAGKVASAASRASKDAPAPAPAKSPAKSPASSSTRTKSTPKDEGGSE